jgi:hypothetical protein
MSEAPMTQARSDQAIHDDIIHLITQYPPLQKDRNAFQVAVSHGRVIVNGHVSTPNIRTYFVNLLAHIPGVNTVEADTLHDDQTIKLEVARRLPPGLKVARVTYGQVVLVGEPPMGMPDSSLIGLVGAVPGVSRVLTGFGG